jgi:hypothetical protein
VHEWVLSQMSFFAKIFEKSLHVVVPGIDVAVTFHRNVLHVCTNFCQIFTMENNVSF